MKVTVSSDHILNGHKQDPYNCPVALALKENRKYTHVVVTLRLITLVTKNSVYAAKPTSDIRHFIINFDMNKKVKPFTTELKLKRLRE